MIILGALALIQTRMVWGCFSGKGMGPLVRVDGKMNHQDYIRKSFAFNST